MCTSGCGFFCDSTLSLFSNSSLLICPRFQYTSPSLVTARLMFSGLVFKTRFFSTGRLILTLLTTTGLVMRKMINSTSMTSTSGVVLMVDTTSSSPSEARVIAMALALLCALRRAHGARQQHRVQIGREAAHFFHGVLVALDEPVVAQNGRNGDEQTEGGHDQRFTHGACHLVDGGLAGDADLGQGVVDAPNGTEQSNERGGRTHRGQERQAFGQTALHAVNGALDGHGDPGVQVDLFQQG